MKLRSCKALLKQEGRIPKPHLNSESVKIIARTTTDLATCHYVMTALLFKGWRNCLQPCQLFLECLVARGQLVSARSFVPMRSCALRNTTRLSSLVHLTLSPLPFTLLPSVHQHRPQSILWLCALCVVALYVVPQRQCSTVGVEFQVEGDLVARIF